MKASINEGEKDLTEMGERDYGSKELPLDERQRNHALSGDYSGYYECKIMPDLLLVYKIVGNELHLVRIGSHTELFKKY